MTRILLVSVVILIANVLHATGLTTFILNTRENPSAPTTIDITSDSGLSKIRQSTFSASRPTKILIHGYGDSFGKDWWMSMVTAFLQSEDLNVIRLDWCKSNLFVLKCPQKTDFWDGALFCVP